MIDEDTISRAVAILREAADPVRIVLHGSYARGNAREDSDLDLLVVEREVHDRHAEMVRLMRALAPLRIAADVLVVSERIYREWSSAPGNVLYQAAREGRILHEAA